jgi:hypothetical protein
MTRARRGTLRLAGVGALLLLLVNGCLAPDLIYSPGTWYIDTIDAADPSSPTFCISATRGCKGSKFYAPSLEVYRVGSEPLQDRNVWTIEQVSGQPITTFTYGVAPEGWKTIEGPAPLERGRFYQIRNSYFTCSGNAPTGSCTVLTEEQFRESQFGERH